MIKEEFSGPFSIYGSSARHKAYKLAEAVNDSEDCIKPSGCRWKMGDPVHGDFFKQLCRSWKQLKQSNWQLGGVLVSLANRALMTEALDVFG